MSCEALTLWRLHPQPVSAIALRYPMTVGRLPASDLHLPEDDVSRFHASLELRDGHPWVVDQGSRNGVYLNGARVGAGMLEPGVCLRIGQTVFWCSGESTFRTRREHLIAQLAESSEPLSIHGPKGTGKRSLARAIHEASGRPGPLIVVEGPPHDALFAVAKGGTLVCSELRAGATLSQASETHATRLITTSSEGEATGPNRLDVPGLAARLDELPESLERVLKGRRWDADLVEALCCHPFRLNFAELSALCADLPVTSGARGISHLPYSFRAQLVEARGTVDKELDRERLHDALTRHRGNVRRVGQELGIARGHLYRLLAGFGLNPDVYRGKVSPLEPAPQAERDERRTLQ